MTHGRVIEAAALFRRGTSPSVENTEVVQVNDGSENGEMVTIGIPIDRLPQGTVEDLSGARLEREVPGFALLKTRLAAFVARVHPRRIQGYRELHAPTFAGCTVEDLKGRIVNSTELQWSLNPGYFTALYLELERRTAEESISYVPVENPIHEE